MWPAAIGWPGFPVAAAGVPLLLLLLEAVSVVWVTGLTESDDALTAGVEELDEERGRGVIEMLGC